MATIESLLERTSRTFALAIPLLPEPLRSDVTLGYLVFRIADTLEDADCWNRDLRVDSLREFQELLHEMNPDGALQTAARWCDLAPTANRQDTQLLRQTADVLAALADRQPAAQQIIRSHALRSAAGMAETLAGADPQGRLALQSISDLRRYCYHVAGIVGEMLTALFREHLAPSPAREGLSLHAAAFGEGLQLVNILKDAAVDGQNGRSYLPRSAPASEVFALAREDLTSAGRYIELLTEAQAPSGCVAFARLPLELAWASLDRIESRGPGAKLTRPEVAAVLSAVTSGILAGRVE